MTVGISSSGASQDERTIKHRVPEGTVVIWEGNTSDIPRNWALADGNNGTVDMLNNYCKLTQNGSSAGSNEGSDSYSIDHSHNNDTNIITVDTYESDYTLSTTPTSGNTVTSGPSITLDPESVTQVFIESLKPVRIPENATTFSKLAEADVPSSFNDVSSSYQHDMLIDGDTSSGNVSGTTPESLNYDHSHNLNHDSRGFGTNGTFNYTAYGNESTTYTQSDVSYTPESVRLRVVSALSSSNWRSSFGQKIEKDMVFMFRRQESDIPSAWEIDTEVPGRFPVVTATDTDVLSTYGSKPEQIPEHSHNYVTPRPKSEYDASGFESGSTDNVAGHCDNAGPVSTKSPQHIKLLVIRRVGV